MSRVWSIGFFSTFVVFFRCFQCFVSLLSICRITNLTVMCVRTALERAFKCSLWFGLWLFGNFFVFCSFNIRRTMSMIFWCRLFLCVDGKLCLLNCCFSECYRRNGQVQMRPSIDLHRSFGLISVYRTNLFGTMAQTTESDRPFHTIF